jgi:hypothetical protein
VESDDKRPFGSYDAPERLFSCDEEVRMDLLHTSTGETFALQIARGKVVNAFGPLPEDTAEKVKNEGGDLKTGDVGQWWCEPETITTEGSFQKVDARETAGAHRST